MSSEKFIKYQSQQNGDFTPTNNRVDFVIPASTGKVSLRDSFVQIYARPIPVDADGDDAIYKCQLAFKDNQGNASQIAMENVAMVKNAHIQCANKGVIESVRRVDILRQNLSYLRKNPTNLQGDKQMSLNCPQSLVNNQKNTIFNIINKEGSVKSQINDNVPIMIRLGDMLDFCDLDVADLGAMGDTRLHIELNVDRIVGVQRKDDPLAEAEKVNNIAQPANNTAITELTVTPALMGLDDSPYFVGQKVEYTGNVNGNAGTTAKAIIKEIDWNPNTGVLVLKFDRTLFTLTPGNGGATGGTLAEVNAQSVGVQFPLCEVVLKVLPPNAESPRMVAYQQFDTYELNGNQIQNYNNIVEIDGRTTNALVMMADTANNGISINARQTDLQSFRMAVNNVDLTDNRDILTYSPLYYDRLINSLRACDYVAKNLLQYQYDVNSVSNFSTNKNDIIGMPLFSTAGRKNLQLNIETTGGLGAYTLFCARPMMIEF